MRLKACKDEEIPNLTRKGAEHFGVLFIWERYWYNYYITLKRKRKEKKDGEK